MVVTEKEEHRKKDPSILTSEPDPLYGYNCVSLVRRYVPNAPGTDAALYPVTQKDPVVGAIGKMYYDHSGLWHVFYVLEVHDSTLTIVDGNYDEGYVTVRTIPRYDPRVLGYTVF